jgi:hypothetical protein
LYKLYHHLRFLAGTGVRGMCASHDTFPRR